MKPAFAVKAFNVVGVRVKVGTRMLICSVSESLPKLLTAVMVALVVPPTVGVPLISPVEVLIDNPAGRLAAV